MKKYILTAVTLLAMVAQTQAQKYLDIYRDGKIVSSVRSSDVDSMVVGTNSSNRKLVFYQNGEVFHHTSTANIDSIKVFRTEDEPLVYLGIVGFNQELYDKPFGVLDKNTASDFKTFVSNLTRKDGTLLYYGVEHAINMLKANTFPTQVSSVNLIIFTDGLDQGSLMMNGSYSTDEQYLNAVNNRILNTRVKGLPVTAYSLGLRGSDVSDYTLFQNNLKKLASFDDKAFEVSSMSAVRTRLQEISDQIISISNKQTISMKIPGQSNGTVIRFTFDGYSPENSTMYIEGTFNLSNRSLTNVTYHGLKATLGSYIQGTQDGIFVTFTFTGMQREDGNGLIPKDYIREYYKSVGASTWQQNSEFTPANNTLTSISHSGAIILLVLDCSSSLGSKFSDMQGYARDFIDRVANNAQEHIDRPFGNHPEDVYTSCPDSNHPHLIDLGLPRGTLWACCNVGASKPEDYGGYFAWGETTEKIRYFWDTYIHCDGPASTCHDIGEDIAGTQYDAATANWGSPWVMPNKEQVEELMNSCVSEWTKENGVNGRRFTGSNGASIFLPAAGSRWYGDGDFTGSQGNYHVSTLLGSGAYEGTRFYFDNDDVEIGRTARGAGHSVRPVRRNRK